MTLHEYLKSGKSMDDLDFKRVKLNTKSKVQRITLSGRFNSEGVELVMVEFLGEEVVHCIHPGWFEIK